MRQVWKTLRFRLTAWNVALVLLTSAATLIGVREGVRRALLHEMEEILEADLREITMELEQIPPPTFDSIVEDLTRKAVGHRQQGWFVQLLDARGQVVWSSHADHPLRDAADPVAVASQFNLRYLTRELPARPSGIERLRVGASLDFLGRDLRRIDRQLELIAALALLAAPIGGYLLAGRAIRPLTNITNTAARLDPYQLDERLPDRSAGDELDQLSHTVNRLLDRLADHIRQRRDLLANSAHELRTPLAAIRTSAEVALDHGRTREEYEELLLIIVDECTSLESLINQLLLLSETENDRIRPRLEQVPLSSLAESVDEMFRAVAESQQLEFMTLISPDITIAGQRQLTRQVLNNLLDNAMKFTPPGGTVRLDVTADAERGLASVVVTDSGRGIAGDDLPRVFERFFRGDKARSHGPLVRGTGLGLSICQSIVEGQGGTISLTSQLGGGTVVTVHWPLWIGRPLTESGLPART